MHCCQIKFKVFPSVLPFRTKMNGINYYPGTSAQTRERHYTIGFRPFYPLFQVIAEPRPMKLNTILIHSPRKEVVNKKNNVLYSICAVTPPDWSIRENIVTGIN